MIWSKVWRSWSRGLVLLTTRLQMLCAMQKNHIADAKAVVEDLLVNVCVLQIVAGELSNEIVRHQEGIRADDANPDGEDDFLQFLCLWG